MDGVDIMPNLAEGQALPERDLFWSLRDQTAIRRSRWKLVLNGELVEGNRPEDAVHLAYLATDMAEKHNLRDKHPSLVADLTATATTWRRDAERNSQRRHTNQR